MAFDEYNTTYTKYLTKNIEQFTETCSGKDRQKFNRPRNRCFQNIAALSLSAEEPSTSISRLLKQEALSTEELKPTYHNKFRTFVNYMLEHDDGLSRKAMMKVISC